jgi:DNA repair photolyase
MPDDEKAGLDPYIAQIIGNRKSGLSLNHIVGCTLNCGYCVRHFWGNYDVKIPHLLCPTDQAIEQLVNHHAFQPHVTPIQLFNKATDPFLPGVKPHLFQVLAALDEHGFTNHMLVITRFKVTAEGMAFLESLKHLRITLLFTYSGITDDRIEPISKSTMTVTSIRTAAEHRHRNGVILYWRPITPGWNDSPETTAHVLDVGRDVDAMVFTGLYHKQENATHLESLGVTVPYNEAEYQRRKTMAADLDTRVVAAWRASGTSTPLFRKRPAASPTPTPPSTTTATGASASSATSAPSTSNADAPAPSNNPPTSRCAQPSTTSGSTHPGSFEDGHVWTTGLGEQRRYALQHHFRYQMWDIETPHVIGAHGRSMTGHDLDPDQAADLERVRRTFALAARTDDD